MFTRNFSKERCSYVLSIQQTSSILSQHSLITFIFEYYGSLCVMYLCILKQRIVGSEFKPRLALKNFRNCTKLHLKTTSLTSRKTYEDVCEVCNPYFVDVETMTPFINFQFHSQRKPAQQWDDDVQIYELNQLP